MYPDMGLLRNSTRSARSPECGTSAAPRFTAGGNVALALSASTVWFVSANCPFGNLLRVTAHRESKPLAHETIFKSFAGGLATANGCRGEDLGGLRSRW